MSQDFSKYECPYSHIEKDCGHELIGPEGYEDTYGVWCACGFRGPALVSDPEELKLKPILEYKKKMNFKIIFDPDMDYSLDTEFEQKFETLAEARAALDAIANYTLHLHKMSPMTDRSNFGLIMVQVYSDYWREVTEDE